MDHNLDIHPDGAEKTAIVIPEDIKLPRRHFEFLKLNFGLASA